MRCATFVPGIRCLRLGGSQKSECDEHAGCRRPGARFKQLSPVEVKCVRSFLTVVLARHVVLSLEQAQTYAECFVWLNGLTAEARRERRLFTSAGRSECERLRWPMMR
jgi:hypothetical protein